MSPVSAKPSARSPARSDRKSTRLNSSHGYISYAVFCLKNKNYADAIATAMIRGAWIRKKRNEECWSDAGREIVRCYLLAADIFFLNSEAVQRCPPLPPHNDPPE